MLHRLERGHGDTGCLFIHGLGDGAAIWEGVLNALPPTLHSLAVDLRGHGDTAWDAKGSYDTASHTTDVSRLLDEIPARWIIVGHSLGADIAVRLAGRDDVRALVLVDYHPTPDPARVERLRQAFATQAEARFASCKDFVTALHAARPLAPPDVIEAIARTALRRGDDGLFKLKCDPRLAVFDPFTEARDAAADERQLKGIARPVLLVRGAGSSLLPQPAAERIAGELLRDGRLAVVPRAGHAVMADNPQALAEAILAFLRALAFA